MGFFRLAHAVGCVAVLLLTACGATVSPFERNPDRDLTGVSSPPPTLPQDLELLRRLAVEREQWQVDLPAAQAVERLTAGARHCHSGEVSMALRAVTFAAVGVVGTAIAGRAGFNVGRSVHVEPWPDLRATAIGLKVDLGSVIGRGYIVLYAVVEDGPARSQVYVYRREDSDVQRNLAALAPVWLAGRTQACEARVD